MFRVLLTALLLIPCPDCWMQRLAIITSVAPASNLTKTCECCDHDGDHSSPPTSPSPKPDCACKLPAVVALQNDQLSIQFHPAIVATGVVVEQTLLPPGVVVRGNTSVAYAIRPSRSSPLRQ
ncbi:MAG: hypothetical protein B7Z55_00320 [Planctomycetales bacterium 12-60-4]|nr:MAG: hypothetical protein B7Z55_00320 [Planctomycetales bacterium 12-60-4]